LVIGKLREINPHILVNTSFYEGIPVSLMETASMAIPMIAPNVCGVPEVVVNGQSGFTFNPLSKDELLDRLHLLSNMTEDEYQSLKSGSYEIQKERFNYQKNYTLLAELFKQP